MICVFLLLEYIEVLYIYMIIYVIITLHYHVYSLYLFMLVIVLLLLHIVMIQRSLFKWLPRTESRSHCP